MTIANSSLKKFSLFSSFTDLQCAYMNDHAKQVDIPANKILLKLGSNQGNIFLLLEGELKLTATDDKETIISANSSRANNPIAHLRPSCYEVSTLTQVKIFVFTEAILNQAIALEKQKENEVDAIKVDYINNHSQVYDKTLFNILSLLHTDQLALPSLPDIALKIRRVAENENSDAKAISHIINMDQSIVTKILKTANSAMYNTSGKKIESSKEAFLRIGTKKLVNLVLSYSMKELFNSDSAFFKSKMQEIWRHSVKVAAISSILTRLTSRFDPEKALLAGLLHNIGAVALLNNLNNDTSLYENEDQLKNILFDLQSEVGEAILSKWGFPDDLINVAKYSTDWHQNKSEYSNYSDIVNIAQLHAFIGTPYQSKLPRIEAIPAFKNLALGKLTPELSMQILKKSEKEINQTIALFN